VGEDVCRALAAVHAAGYVHRDVKAQNVMRDKSGKVVLMDFGTGQDASRTRPADLVGTPLYMAPEVLAGRPASVQSDVYAVGVLLYHLVTGQYPVEGRTEMEVIEAHRAGRRHTLLERRPDLSMPFVQVVSKALAPDPADRWKSAGALLEALAGPSGRGTTTEWPWARTIARVLATAGASVAGLIVVGMVTSRYFNVMMAREGFVSEGIRDWLSWGVVSMVAPVVLALMVLIGLSFVRLAFRVLLWLWPGGRRLAEGLWAALHRLGLDDLEFVSAGALAASVAVLAWVGWLLWSDFWLLWTLHPDVSTAPADRLAFLSPSFESRHTAYRLTLEWACIIVVALWWVPFRLAARRGQRLNPGMIGAAATILAFTLLLLHFPYRLLYHAEFDVVEWRGQRCFAVGERQAEYLVFCPDLEPPRNRIVRKDAGEVRLVGTKMNPFEHARFPQERP
jgi:Protein kinase domain